MTADEISAGLRLDASAAARFWDEIAGFVARAEADMAWRQIRMVLEACSLDDDRCRAGVWLLEPFLVSRSDEALTLIGDMSTVAGIGAALSCVDFSDAPEWLVAALAPLTPKETSEEDVGHTPG